MVGRGHLVPETKRLKDRAEDARRRFEESVKGLYRKDGSRVYSDEEHEERLAALRRERNAELREIRRRAQEIFDEAWREAEVASDFAPDSVLSDAERQQANSRMVLVQADVDGLDPAALAHVLRRSSPAETWSSSSPT